MDGHMRPVYWRLRAVLIGIFSTLAGRVRRFPVESRDTGAARFWHKYKLLVERSRRCATSVLGGHTRVYALGERARRARRELAAGCAWDVDDVHDAACGYGGNAVLIACSHTRGRARKSRHVSRSRLCESFVNTPYVGYFSIVIFLTSVLNTSFS